MYCPECGAGSREGVRFCTKCGTALEPSRPEHRAEDYRLSGARYSSAGQFLWGGLRRKTDLELAKGNLRFKEGEIGIDSMKSVSIVKEPFAWILLAVGPPAFLIGLYVGGDLGLLLKSIGIGGVFGSIVGWLITRRATWLLVEYAGQGGESQKVYFKMDKREAETLLSIIQSHIRR